MKAFARKANDIEILGIKLKVAGVQFAQFVNHALLDYRKPRREPASGRQHQHSFGAGGICAEDPTGRGQAGKHTQETNKPAP
ncbi:MAG: hypothetical protein ACXWX7_08470 [Candidatus Binatia bacterium]